MPKIFVAGFTFIEIMIVILIIGIITRLAIPNYQHYIARARFTEVMTLADFYKTEVALALQSGRALEEINNQASFLTPPPTPTENLANLIIENGTIIATATERLNKATYILKPNANGTTFTLTGTCQKLHLC